MSLADFRPALWRDGWDRDVDRAKNSLGGSPATLSGIRPEIKDSWTRALKAALTPASTEPRSVWSRSDLADYRNAHPLARLLPIVQRVLLRYTVDQGLIVAIGDEAGRLLWVNGNDQAMRKAEHMGFVEGADWSEESMGTSAPGTALWLGRGVQVRQAEHFSHIVEPWSCSAVPIREPGTDQVLGVLDITGDDRAVAPETVPLLEATVAAMESELRARALSVPAASTPSPRIATPTPVLRVLGKDLATIESVHTAPLTLGEKHSEILAILAHAETGLSAEELSDAVYGPGHPLTTIRAEVSRVKKVLTHSGLDLGIDSRPYRLRGSLDTDIKRVRGFLSRGAHRVALAKYVGPVLPHSAAPGVEALRQDSHHHLREVLMQDASVELLLDYAHHSGGCDDLPLWQMCLELLPPKSPRRAEVVLRIEALEARGAPCNQLQPSTSYPR